jgi:hypothetical protein
MKKSKWINIITIVLALVIIGLLIWIIVSQVKEHMLQDDPMLHTLKNVLIPIDPDIKNVKLFKGNKSYTINKDKIFLCLKDEKGEYYNLNTLLYVFLHEWAHRLNREDVGHTEAFHRIFDQLLDRATKLGIFNPSIPIPTDYCEYSK